MVVVDVPVDSSRLSGAAQFARAALLVQHSLEIGGRDLVAIAQVAIGGPHTALVGAVVRTRTRATPRLQAVTRP